MKVLGIDFTSAPSRRKPLTCAVCDLDDGVLRLETVQALEAFDEFEQVIDAPGPWIAGIDFPFGQPAKLITNLGWPAAWRDYVARVADLSKDEWRQTLTKYRTPRPEGDKQHLRPVDELAKSCSPMMLYGVPVGLMFFEGAPRLLRSSASILPCRLNDSMQLVVEAYPALVARRWGGETGYKNDTKKKQTEAHLHARESIVAGLTSDQCEGVYEFRVRFSSADSQHCIDDPTADLLDAVLCAVQAAWAFMQAGTGYGIPIGADVNEGWIPDPAVSG